MSKILNNLLVFGRLLRSLGIEVHEGRLLDVIEALQHVDIGVRDEVYHTCRALLVHRHEHLAIFDRAFDAFWSDHTGLFAPAGSEKQDQACGRPPGDRETDARTVAASHGSERDDRPRMGVIGTWSDVGALAHKDFAQFTPDEVVLGRAALDRLVWNPGERRTRRWIPGRGKRVDLRRALAQSVRTGGEIVKLPTRRRRARPRTLVILCDVSGSMERYSRMLLHFAHAMVKRHRRVEAFLFSTELTRITTELRNRRLDDAVAAVSRSVPDWSGGTRIGAAIGEFHRRWTRRALHGSPVVLLISDGWDRGDPIVLRDQIARLQRSCRRLIWLNPLIGTADYAPLTRGLQAALPFVDDFLPARTLTNLADLARHLNALDGR
jgi:uncharacterized protein with von Willebrand factor type A (vWA) domain